MATFLFKIFARTTEGLGEPAFPSSGGSAVVRAARWILDEMNSSGDEWNARLWDAVDRIEDSPEGSAGGMAGSMLSTLR